MLDNYHVIELIGEGSFGKVGPASAQGANVVAALFKCSARWSSWPGRKSALRIMSCKIDAAGLQGETVCLAWASKNAAGLGSASFLVPCCPGVQGAPKMHGPDYRHEVHSKAGGCRGAAAWPQGPVAREVGGRGQQHCRTAAPLGWVAAPVGAGHPAKCSGVTSTLALS